MSFSKLFWGDIKRTRAIWLRGRLDIRLLRARFFAASAREPCCGQQLCLGLKVQILHFETAVHVVEFPTRPDRPPTLALKTERLYFARRPIGRYSCSRDVASPSELAQLAATHVISRIQGEPSRTRCPPRLRSTHMRTARTTVQANPASHEPYGSTYSEGGSRPSVFLSDNL